MRDQQRRLPPRRPLPPPGPERPRRPRDPLAEAETTVIPQVKSGKRAAPVEPPTEFIRPEDPPTEFIAVYQGDLYDGQGDGRDDRDDEYFDDEYDDDYDDYDDDYEDDPPPKPESTLSKVIRTAGEVMITAGLVMLLFVVYEVWVTDLVSAGKQRDVTTAMDEEWSTPDPDAAERGEHFEFAEGHGMAKLYIPAFGSDYRFTVVEGTNEADLEVGPGHYKTSAYPGQPGNFSVAGHRVGKGAPFNDLDLLRSCDAIVVETRSSWYVYRMLPTTEDAKNWAAQAADPRCVGAPGSTPVVPMTGQYKAAVGRKIITPTQSEVVAPVPGNVAATVPPEQRLKLLTLTTCHPKFSNRQRLVVHAVMVRQQPKTVADPKALPVELKETE